MENLEILVSNPRFLSKIGHGDYGEVYRIGKSYVAKFLLEMPCYQEGEKGYGISKDDEELIWEYNFAKIAYNGGVSVPKPEGVFLVEHPKLKQFYPAFVMEYIDGKSLGAIKTLDKNLQLAEKVSRMLNVEKNKLSELNLDLVDESENNVLWDEKNKKVYLIDFGYWEFKDE